MFNRRYCLLYEASAEIDAWPALPIGVSMRGDFIVYGYILILDI